MKITRWLPMATLMLGLTLGAIFFPVPATLANTAPTTTTDQLGGPPLAPQEQVFADVYRNVAPSVVSITVAERSPNSQALFDIASGSGFVFDTEGHIVTNFHVVQGADRIEVRMYDGTITSAEVVALDGDSDIAVIRIDVPVERLHPVTLADSDALQVGQTVLALGNPFERTWTLTSGIVSALNRTISGITLYSVGGVIQTDAAINPGNSGGPLVNLSGQVIGMNTQIATETGGNSGIGFAVPSNLIRKVATSLIQTGSIRYPLLGVTRRQIDLDLIQAFQLPDNIRGVAVLEATTGLPAATAGLQSISRSSIDVIIAIDNVPIQDFEQLIGYLAIHTEPGQTVSITIYRSGQILTVPVTLTARQSR